ncbi:hypothetical protein [Nocardioides stalactiti]|uniref:hypothetical protein n=1 Tax=Nocardioides stalactiti TaxID=2755356 RepID=UPI0016044E8F|nr:hypothetical protein [Nocardioides stalactiti]
MNRILTLVPNHRGEPTLIHLGGPGGHTVEGSRATCAGPDVGPCPAHFPVTYGREAAKHKAVVR